MIKSKFKNNVLFSRLLPILTPLMLIPFIITIIIISYYNAATISDKTKQQQESILYQLEEKLTETDTDANSIQFIMQNDVYAVSYMSQKSIYELAPIAQARLLSNLTNNITYNMSGNSDIMSIYLYNAVSDHAVSSKTVSSTTLFPCKEIYEKHEQLLKANAGNAVIFSGNDFLTYCYPYKVNNDVISGALFVNIDKNAFNINGSYTVFNSNGDVILSNDAESAEAGFNPDKMPSERISVWKAGKTKYDALKDDLGRFYVLKTPKTFTGPELFRFIMPILLYLILVTVLSLAVAFFCASYLTKSITSIVLSLDGKQDTHTENSLKYLFNTIAHHSSSKRITDITPKLMHLQKSQTIALQTQLTPHFLYNTLNSINLLVMSHCDDEAPSQMITLFSDILREALNTKTYLIPLYEELQITNKYISLQKIKYSDLFDVTYDISDDTLDCCVIKLSLQPIIENALHHGILPLEKKGNIIISAKKNGKKLIITISNDGVRIPQKKLDELQTILSNENEIYENTHLGIANVSQRIKLVFGSEYGCEISSDEKSTKISLILPVSEVSYEK